MLNLRGWEVYRFLDFPVILLDLLSPLPLLIFRLFSWTRNLFPKFILKNYLMFCINVLKVLHLFDRVALLVLLHNIYNYKSEQFVVKASKLLCNFIFLIILCQQFFKHFSIYISVVDEFFIKTSGIYKSFFEVNQYLRRN